jgi:deoxyribodipyrimidine photo-lyase
MHATPSLVWFRQDLRLDDHAALHAAIQHGGPVIPVFIWAPAEAADWAPGGASRWWLHQSLTRLDAALRQCGSRLVIRQGDSLSVLQALQHETGAEVICWNRRYEPAIAARDARLKTTLRQQGITVETFNGALLFEPWEVCNKQGKPFQVFTPFWKACLALPEAAEPLPAPVHLPAPHLWPASQPLASLELEPTIDWAAGMRAAWRPGEQGANEQMQRFLDEALAGYADDRNRPDCPGSSRLSPYVHFGEISPRRLWHTVQTQVLAFGGGRVGRGAEVYQRELGWREFAYHVLYHFPHTVEVPLRPEFAAFPWQDNSAFLRAWQRGRTGFPLVDAGMRELWATGWMHNRVRMVVASFLVKDLLISWRAGAAWFWDTLVDADLANNTLGWQWTAGCGADAAPFFRMFNPVLQGQKFDPCGDYVRRWVPELSGLAPAWIHKPWEAPDEVLSDAGIKLGQAYPMPIVEHRWARDRALKALESMRQTTNRGVPCLLP